MEIIRVVTILLKQQFTFKRLLPILIFFHLYTLILMLPFSNLANHFKETYPVSIVTVLFTSQWFTAISILSVILLFSNLPLKDTFQFWLILKIGQKKWMLSQFIYLIIASLIASIYQIISILITFLPTLHFSNHWGRLLPSLAQGRISFPEGVDSMTHLRSIILQYYSPYGAFFQIFLLLFLMFILIGGVIFVFNSHYSNLGNTLACGLVIVELFITEASRFWIKFLSPLTWLDFHYIKYEAHSGLLSLPEIITRILLLYLLLTIILVVMKKIRRQ
ncbi:hypothetical protein E3V38_09980 [Streptococcus pseudopneumoniae]|uniref:hypothetical protein n=1 Tax=Streptococcus TaxID=1301 RepID=UPI00110C31A4|nr:MULTISPECIES: hypothetical protein [Streptococcus]MBF9648818.1 hypothetical protein [Streptococcus pseudopneumoniae]MBF9677004.1 hypothetical protein [Streptococcus pseudopneumoniae]MBW8105304.1 hypothetical protein [Streptococcus pseudopneumoniae]NIB95235.1 hypothetical protein [Streptococcus pseudopneumoniae]NIB96518.1 hypothetical protein [Streptococcus pseudopneumoniae]